MSTTVHSFTKDRDYEVVISSDFLTPKDNILFVDDFLAYGNAALGVIDLIKQSGANLVGMGFIIEKAFQNGRKTLEERGVRVESLAIIEDLSNCQITIKINSVKAFVFSRTGYTKAFLYNTFYLADSCEILTLGFKYCPLLLVLFPYCTACFGQTW